MRLKNIIILQNKIDLVKEAEAAAQYDEIRSFIQGSCADSAPIIPISAQLRYNIDLICEHIVRWRARAQHADRVRLAVYNASR